MNGRELVAQGWSQGADARDSDQQPVHPWSSEARSWSVLGAIVCGDATRQGASADRPARGRRHAARAAPSIRRPSPSGTTSLGALRQKHLPHSTQHLPQPLSGPRARCEIPAPDPRDRALLIRTETLFRDVNEAVQVYYRVGERTEAQFVCECSDPGCVDKLLLTRAEYGGGSRLSDAVLPRSGARGGDSWTGSSNRGPASPSSRSRSSPSLGNASAPRGVDAATQKGGPR